MKKMRNFFREKKDWLIITFCFLLATLILYGYFWFFHPQKLQWIYQNWDGPGYLVVAKSFYDPEIYAKVNFIHFLDVNHSTAQFPLYPVFIRLFSFIGYFRSMLFVSQLFALLSIILFYEIVKKLKISKNPLGLSLPMIFLTPRWFIVSHVGSSEPIFIFFMLLFLFFLTQKKYLLSAIFGAFAQAARPPGILLFVAVFSLFFFDLIKTKTNFKSFLKKITPYFLIPLTLSLIFGYYQIKLNNFFAYFYAIDKEFKQIQFPFIRIFSYPKPEITTFWQEINVVNYLLYLTAAFFLIKKGLYPFAAVAFTFYSQLALIVHMDISRYALPMLPFLFIAFSEIIETKYFRLALFIILPAIYAYSYNFMCWNLGP